VLLSPATKSSRAHLVGPLRRFETLSAGTAIIDDDVMMKARGIARERGIEIE